MLKKIKFLLPTLMLTTFFSQAQIGLNTTTFSGNATLGYQITSADNFKFTNTAATFNPNYGKFIGKKTLLSLQPDLLYGRYSLDATSIRQNYETGNIGLNATLRHYVNPDAKFKLYGEALFGATKYWYPNDFGGGPYEFTVGRIGAAVGANYFLNKTIALDAKIGYTREQNLAGSINGGSGNNFYVGVGLANFMHADSETGEGAELIAKGRISVDGNIGLTVDGFGTGFKGQAKYSQFIANGLMVGGSIEGSKNSSFQRFRDGFNVSALARYYVPLTKKLFIYPEAKVTYADYGVGRFYYDFGVGMSYFVKKNVALDINLFRIGTTSGQTNTFLGANVGLKYFLK